MLKAWQAWQTWMAVATAPVVLGLSGCSTSSSPVEHYVSPQIQGVAQKINLDEVQKAFFNSKGKDFNSWMAAFEKRVNEIYEGKEVVSLDATRKDGKIVVVGYVNKLNKEGFQPGDEKLFTIEQTGEAVNDQMPYRISGYNDRQYYEGRHSILDNPFLQAMLISHFMGGWGGHYYTPYNRVAVLHDHRDLFRSTPDFSQQQAKNQGFFSRFKSNSQGQLQSSKSFGNTEFSGSSSASKRSWSYGSPSASPAGSNASSGFSSDWGGRRSSGGGLFSGRGSSRWGGFRRR